MQRFRESVFKLITYSYNLFMNMTRHIVTMVMIANGYMMCSALHLTVVCITTWPCNTAASGTGKRDVIW